MVAGYRTTPVTASESDGPALHKLETILQDGGIGELCLTGPNGEAVRMPGLVAATLRQAVRALVRGNAVMVVSLDTEVTTQQAATLLGVSRPNVIKLPEEGEIPYRVLGTHRRIRVEDLFAYDERVRKIQRAALAQMDRDAQKYGLMDGADGDGGSDLPPAGMAA